MLSIPSISFFSNTARLCYFISQIFGVIVIIIIIIIINLWPSCHRVLCIPLHYFNVHRQKLLYLKLSEINQSLLQPNQVSHSLKLIFPMPFMRHYLIFFLDSSHATSGYSERKTIKREASFIQLNQFCSGFNSRAYFTEQSL